MQMNKIGHLNPLKVVCYFVEGDIVPKKTQEIQKMTHLVFQQRSFPHLSAHLNFPFSVIFSLLSPSLPQLF